MARTLPDLVAELVSVNPNISLDPFITAASGLVDQIEERTDAPSEEQLAIIETWLSAHFYCMRDPRRASERAGDVQASYEGKFDLGLSLSRYGQMAMLLDVTGHLRKLNLPQPIVKRQLGVHWVGRDPS